MGDCDVFGCDGDDKISYNCNECGLTFCSEHRLPESHNCSALRRGESKSGPVFSTGLQNKEGKKRGLTNRSDRVVRGSSDTEKQGDRTSDAERSDDSSGSRLRDYMHGADRSDKPRSKGSNSSSKTNLRQYQNNTKSPSQSSAHSARDGYSGDSFSGGGYSIRWGTWLYRLVVLIVLAAVVSVLLVGFTSVTVPEAVPPQIGDPIEEAAGISAGLVSNATNDSAVQDLSSENETVSEPSEGEDSNIGLDRTKIEHLVHVKVNEERQSEGLNELSYDTDLVEIARYHSEDMAQNDYFAHTAPDGEEMEDRYDSFNYECRVDVSGNQYATGGENIFKQSYTGYTFTNEELASETVEGWMNSPTHRENMLKDYWNKEGIGVYIEEDGSETTVYVTQNFC